MKKIIALLVLVISIFSSTCFAASFSYTEDLQLGAFKVGDTYNEAKAISSYGKIVKNKKLKDKHFGPTQQITFEKALVALRKSRVVGVETSKPYIATPKGIKVGDTTRDIINAYGDQAQTASDGTGNTMAVFGGQGAELIFTINSKNQVVSIEVYGFEDNKK